MDQPIALAQKVHEGTKVDDLDHLAIIDATNLRFSNNPFNPIHRCIDTRFIWAGYFDETVVFNVNLCARRFCDFTDHFATRANDVADFVAVDLDRTDLWRVRADLRTGTAECFIHLPQDVDATIFGLIKSNAHDVCGDARDLDVHLKTGDTIGGTSNFEIHIAQVIFIPQNVRQNSEPVALFNQPHSNTSDGAWQRDTRVHHSQGATTNGSH